MRELERLSRSKYGDSDLSEDDLIVTADFAGVIDGATSPARSVQNWWRGLTAGRVAAQAICEAIQTIPADSEAVSAVERLSNSVADAYRNAGQASLYEHMIKHPEDRATASAVVFSRHRRELWFVGDCQALLVTDQGKLRAIQNPKRVDEVTAAARSLFLEAEVASGRPIYELIETDEGREFIRPLLEKQRTFQNSHFDSEYSYSAIDGFPLTASAIRIERISPEVRFAILATDGYPKLLPTLEATEEFRKAVCDSDDEARLMFRGPYKSTKGVPPDGESFDDRTYLRIEI